MIPDWPISSAMIKVFLDTNVLVDYFMEERPHHDQALTIFSAAKSHRCEAVLTIQSILDAAYIATGRKSGVNPDGFKKAILDMLNYLNISHIDLFEIRDALLAPDMDIEDNALYAHAYSEACDVIITGDREFIQRETPGDILMMTPEEFVARMR